MEFSKEELQICCAFFNKCNRDFCELFVEKYFGKGVKWWLYNETDKSIMHWPLYVKGNYFEFEDIYAALYEDIPYKCILNYISYKTDCHNKCVPTLRLGEYYLYHFKKNEDASKDQPEEKACWWRHESGDYDYDHTIIFWPGNTVTRISDCTDYTRTTDHPTTTILRWSIELSCDDDSDDESTNWYDKADGWEDEKIRRRPGKYCKARSCNKSCRAWDCKYKCGQCRNVQQRRWRRIRWDHK